MYADDLEFVWDPRKSEANLALRGLTVERADSRRDYGEPRVVALGPVDGICLTVVYTDRRNASGGIERRVISARQSNRKERMIYEKASRRIHT